MESKKKETKGIPPRPMTLVDWFLVLFVGLKLTHEIDWSWWLVLTPLWVTIIVAGVVGGFLAWRNQ